MNRDYEWIGYQAIEEHPTQLSNPVIRCFQVQHKLLPKRAVDNIRPIRFYLGLIPGGSPEAATHKGLDRSEAKIRANARLAVLFPSGGL